MKQVIIWYLIAQKFILGIYLVVYSIPFTFDMVSAIIDIPVLQWFLGTILYIIIVFPMAYVVGSGYDNLVNDIKNGTFLKPPTEEQLAKMKKEHDEINKRIQKQEDDKE